MLDTVKNGEAQGIEIAPINGRIGAIIRGVTISDDMPKEHARAIYDAMLRYKVVFLRDQFASDVEMNSFAKLLGEPAPYKYDTNPVDGDYAWHIHAGEIRSDHWHSDLSWTVDPVSVGILSPVTLPEYGGETVWSNLVAAYDEMPAPLRAMADQLWAVHSTRKPIQHSFANLSQADLDKEKMFATADRGTMHPVVTVHPETGERSLMLGNVFSYFEGFTRTPGQHIYEALHFYATRPENTMRWHWRLGDVAIWDNRASLHYGVLDFGDQPRSMRRISLKGVPPRSIDGRCSTRLE
jgi:alpha-ketoglutarate-dependent sulfate ester dioxygenase